MNYRVVLCGTMLDYITETLCIQSVMLLMHQTWHIENRTVQKVATVFRCATLPNAEHYQRYSPELADIAELKTALIR